MPFAGLTNSGVLEHFAQKALSVFVLSGVTGGSLGCVPQRVLRASTLVQRRALWKPIFLIVPTLVHIREQPQSTQNTLRGGDTALPFPKGALPANGLWPAGPVQPV